jgi:hypothetical protein
VAGELRLPSRRGWHGEQCGNARDHASARRRRHARAPPVGIIGKACLRSGNAFLDLFRAWCACDKAPRRLFRWVIRVQEETGRVQCVVGLYLYCDVACLLYVLPLSWDALLYHTLRGTLALHDYVNKKYKEANTMWYSATRLLFPSIT